MSFHLRIAAAGLALVLALASCHRGQAERRPNILMIVVDTLRADRLGVYGNERGLTPFIDSLAGRGTVFLNAYSTTSWTCPSVASLMTSRYPTQHRVVSFESVLAAAELTLAEKLAELGYVAGGFSANFRLMASQGYGQGFRHWQADLVEGDVGGAELRAQALAWLDGVWQRTSPEPALLYLQYMEPHAPYDPPEPYRSRLRGDRVGDAAVANQRLVALRWWELEQSDVDLLEAFYDGEVATVDQEIRRLFDDLGQRGFLDNAIVVITSDHGEEFWEHGSLAHGTSLYGESVRVPLIIALPGQREGRRVEENVSLLDVAPTLLDLLARPLEPRFEGRSLAGFLRSPKGAAAPNDASDVILQLEAQGGGLDSREHAAAIVRGPAKVLVRPNGRTEAYDLKGDPAEIESNPGEPSGAAAGLVQSLEAAQKDLSERAGAEAPRSRIDEATREKLRALGYHL